MRGEELETAHIGFSGVYGDRVFAFHNSRSPASFPYLTARTQRQMLQYVPRFRGSEKAHDPQDVMVEVRTPDGEILAVDDPALIRRLAQGLNDSYKLTLLRSERAMTDCHPISLFALQTARQLGEELGVALDRRRFRANVYLDLANANGFAENALVGSMVRLGTQVVLSILERDTRCQMISLDPESGESAPEVLRKVAGDHGGTAGVYASVVAEGSVHRGDSVELLN
jgi:uncharacterized protein YcbX